MFTIKYLCTYDLSLQHTYFNIDVEGTFKCILRMKLDDFLRFTLMQLLDLEIQLNAKSLIECKVYLQKFSR